MQTNGAVTVLLGLHCQYTYLYLQIYLHISVEVSRQVWSRAWSRDSRRFHQVVTRPHAHLTGSQLEYNSVVVYGPSQDESRLYRKHVCIKYKDVFEMLGS